MKSIRLSLPLVLGTLVSVAIIPAAIADISVVVSSKSAATPLSADQVAQVFAGKASAFADGRKTRLLDLPDSSAARSEFYTKSAGRNISQIKAYWARIVFTGKGQAPAVVADADAVKKAVAADPNTVGYIDSGKVDASVKVIATVK